MNILRGLDRKQAFTTALGVRNKQYRRSPVDPADVDVKISLDAQTWVPIEQAPTVKELWVIEFSLTKEETDAEVIYVEGQSKSNAFIPFHLQLVTTQKNV